LATVERLLPLARQSRITLATGDLPEVLVRGDPRYLGQMLTNLIENAIKYSSGVGKRVHVELAGEQERWAVIRVQDDGPGMSEEHLPSLFERFYRVDKVRSRRHGHPSERSTKPEAEEPGGSGLGLAIVQWIVQAHGGEVRVESTIGIGSLFEVRLPRLDDTSTTPSDATVPAPVLFPASAQTPPARMGDGKEQAMAQGHVEPPSSTFTAFGVLVVCEAIVFLVAAALHTGAFGVAQLLPAMMAEGLCCLGCILSAYAMFLRKRWAKKSAMLVQALILLGVLLGVFELIGFPDLDTRINLGLHAAMLVLIIVGLALLVLPGTRAGFPGATAHDE
jgi:hypothetical protein